MVGSVAYGQSLFDPRSIGMGAYGPCVKDSRGFVANPAGLVSMRDWDLNLATYVPTSVKGSGFVFHGFGLGKRFLENEAVAVQYSPGATMEFVQLSTLTINGAKILADRWVSYTEPFAFGFAHGFSDQIMAGFSGRMRTEKITDTRYQFQTLDTTIASTESASASEYWLIDVGLYWRPVRSLTISAVGRSLFTLKNAVLPPELEALRLPSTRAFELGVGYDVTHSLRITAEASTRKSYAIGYEWSPGFNLALRNGFYFSSQESPFGYGMGVSAGWSYGFFELDASYLLFFNQDQRQGSAAAGEFDAQSIRRLDLSPFTSNRLSLSVKAIFGNIRESLARIEGVEMFGPIYPSSYEALAYRPIGKVLVKNISTKPIQAKASFYLDRYMDTPTETPQVYIMPGGEAEIPFTAVFNELVKKISKMTIRDGDVRVSAAPAEEYDDRYQTRVLIRGRNDWDGDVHSLRYFVTPDDPAVIRYTRDILLQQRDTLVRAPKEMEAFVKAKLVLNAFAGKIVYVNDPKQSADYVQYPMETLSLRGGDCDDLTVCFSSLLNSIGISTAFVDVVPPGRPEKSHIYMLVDTGLDPKFGQHIAENPKRYILRRNPKGAETVWIPVESTAITRGFDEAWTAGAQEYFDDVEVGLGLVKQWVRILDVY